MPEKRYGSTRGKILRAAAKLFSKSGYHRVTMREIAQDSEINAASIYHYFPSKADILKSLYAFYSAELHKALPDLHALLRLAETDPPHEVLMKAEFHFDQEARDFLDQILITAAREISADSESERFIRENIFAPTENIIKPLLQRMVELGRIQPLDIETLLTILVYYCFSAAALNHSPFGNKPEKYQSDLSFIFSFIKPM
ncbi:MAG: TetR/AcrR family transcriptional regulator [Clostridia bacterium]|nr:TetR/AcrR family transcriptional regulator [Clostridia bacterium]